MSSSTRV